MSNFHPLVHLNKITVHLKMCCESAREMGYEQSVYRSSVSCVVLNLQIYQNVPLEYCAIGVLRGRWNDFILVLQQWTTRRVNNTIKAETTWQVRQTKSDPPWAAHQQDFCRTQSASWTPLLWKVTASCSTAGTSFIVQRQRAITAPRHDFEIMLV